jgi:hypothetical protein
MFDPGNDRRIIVHPPVAADFVSLTAHDIPNVASDSAVLPVIRALLVRRKYQKFSRGETYSSV